METEQTQPLPIAAASDSEPSDHNDIPPSPPSNKTNDNVQQNDDNTSSNDGEPSQTQQQLPIEYQLHEVDLTNPEMDPLEYAFRKCVPIPKSYFWDTASESNDYNQNLPFRLKLWHNTIYYLGVCLKKAEGGGEVVANFLGVNSGPFDYVTENMTEQEMERSREIVESRREEQIELERRKEGFV
mmetsp:Transcript_25203/g.39693  ORF Transcript_25203/g.39693 Transcript_25203/m.39693 type:complete len:184 (+) Transcript_25203:2-553(+)